jgi:hypothetical protein
VLSWSDHDPSELIPYGNGDGSQASSIVSPSESRPVAFGAAHGWIPPPPEVVVTGAHTCDGLDPCVHVPTGLSMTPPADEPM